METTSVIIIEKLCEYSGTVYGWEMYSYKLNHIQIHPCYRKVFRGATAELFVFYNNTVWVNRQSHIINFHAPDDYLLHGFRNESDYIRQRKQSGERLTTQYAFCLRVYDLDLAGEVGGYYWNWTSNLTTTIRRLKRMLRVRRLPVIFVESTHGDLFPQTALPHYNFVEVKKRYV